MVHLISFLSALLPYDPNEKNNGSLQTSLQEYRALLTAAVEADKAWDQGELEKFDSLVGENACQIRAVWAALSATEAMSGNDHLKSQIIQAIDKIDLLLIPKTISKLMHTSISLQAVLEKEELEITLTSQELFRLTAFLLAEMKDVDEEASDSLYRVERSEPKKLARFGQISNMFARSLLSKLRKHVATASVAFIQEKAAALPNAAPRMVSQDFTVVHNALPCIPMFWTYQTVLHTAQQEGIPLIIHAKFIKDGQLVDEEKLFFTLASCGSYIHLEPSEGDLDRPACVVQGAVMANDQGELLTKDQWHSLIKQGPISDVILAGAADHRQYPDPALDQSFDISNDSEYIAYKALAKKEGYSACNPTTFFIQHVYASLTGTILKQRTPIKPQLTCPKWSAAMQIIRKQHAFYELCRFIETQDALAPQLAHGS